MSNLPNTNLYNDILQRSFADANSENAGLTTLTTNVNGLVAQGGTTYDIPTLGNVTLSEYTDGTDITDASPATGTLKLIVKNYAVNLPVSHFLNTTSQVELFSNFGQKGAEALVNAKEAAIVAAGATATNTVAIGTTNVTTDFQGINLYFRSKFSTTPIWMVASPADFDKMTRAHEAIGNNVTTLGDRLNEVAPQFRGSARYIALQGVNLIDSTHVTTGSAFAFTAGGIHYGERNNEIRRDWVVAKGQDVIQVKSTFGAGAVDNDKATVITIA